MILTDIVAIATTVAALTNAAIGVLIYWRERRKK